MEKGKPIIMFFSYIFGMSLLSLIIDKIGDNVFLKTIPYIILIGLFYFFNKNEINKMFKDFIKNYKKYLKIIIPIWVIGFLLMMLANYLLSSSLPQNELVVREEIKNNLIFMIVVSTLFSPILEELVFRLGFNVINNKYIYLFISSILFAFMHITNSSELLYLIPYSILGITFGLSYLKTNNIFSSILVHIIHNILVLIIVI